MDEEDGGMLGCIGALMKVEQRVKAASQLTQPAISDRHCVNRVSSKLHLGVTLAANFSWNDLVNRVLQNISGPLALCKNLGYRHRLPSKP